MLNFVSPWFLKYRMYHVLTDAKISSVQVPFSYIDQGTIGEKNRATRYFLLTNKYIIENVCIRSRRHLIGCGKKALLSAHLLRSFCHRRFESVRAQLSDGVCTVQFHETYSLSNSDIPRSYMVRSLTWNHLLLLFLPVVYTHSQLWVPCTHVHNKFLAYISMLLRLVTKQTSELYVNVSSSWILNKMVWTIETRNYIDHLSERKKYFFLFLWEF